MKNIFTCILILVALQAHAQQDGLEVIPKGTKFIGGNLSINLNNDVTKIPDTDDSKTKMTSFGIGPMAGKYIRDNVAAGLVLSYNFQLGKNEYSDGTENKSTYNAGAVSGFIRKNYKIVPNMFFFLEAEASLSYGTAKNISVSDTETKLNRYSAGLGGAPGLQFFVGKKFSFETTLGSIGYQFSHTKYDDSDVYTNSHDLGLNGGLGSISFSVSYYIFQ